MRFWPSFFSRRADPDSAPGSTLDIASTGEMAIAMSGGPPVLVPVAGPSSDAWLAERTGLAGVSGAVLPITGGSSAGASPLDQIVNTMLDALDHYLPAPPLAPAPPLPNASVSLASAAERSVGLGGRRGTELRGPFGVVALKGGRLDAVVRFQLWAGGPVEADTAIADLHDALQADRTALRANGFLQLTLAATVPAADVPAIGGWRTQADYRVLFELQYEDTDGAGSLITRIPIDIVGEVPESTVVSDELVRWDDEAAPPLVVHGRSWVGRLSTLAFLAGPSPAGTVTLRRTFDLAVGVPATAATLADFWNAVGGPNPVERHAEFAFVALTDFLAALDPGGDPIALGDWDADSVPDSYASRELVLDVPIELPSVTDRFEVIFGNAAFDQTAVVYLRAMRS